MCAADNALISNPNHDRSAQTWIYDICISRQACLLRYSSCSATHALIGRLCFGRCRDLCGLMSATSRSPACSQVLSYASLISVFYVLCTQVTIMRSAHCATHRRMISYWGLALTLMCAQRLIFSMCDISDRCMLGIRIHKTCR